MTAELISKLEVFCAALNAVNDEFRACLKAQRIETTEDLFSIVENKPLVHKLAEAEDADIRSLALLAFAYCGDSVQ